MIKLDRKLDDLGRVVLPKEYRKQMRLHKGDPIRVEVRGNMVILQAAEKRCCLCEATGVHMYQIDGKDVCEGCVARIRQL